MADSPEPFDQGARDALRSAEGEARRLGTGAIGTEHLLLGLMHDTEGVGSRTLNALGVSHERIRSTVELVASGQLTAEGWGINSGVRRQGGGETSEDRPTTPTRKGSIAWTLRARKAIEHADAEARRLHHPDVGTGELLLGLIDEGDNVATGIRASVGVDLGMARIRIWGDLRE